MSGPVLLSGFYFSCSFSSYLNKPIATRQSPLLLGTIGTTNYCVEEGLESDEALWRHGAKCAIASETAAVTLVARYLPHIFNSFILLTIT